MKRARPIPWDIYEEHLDEAAFLWGFWEQAMVAANYALDDVVVGPEERLLAHLDGLVLGGKPVADKLLFPALAGEEPEKIFAAAWVLVHAEDADHLDAVLSALAKAEPPARAAVARALELSHRADLAKRMKPLWEKSEAPVRAVVLDVVGPRDRAWEAEQIGHAIASREPAILAAALRAARRAPDPAFGGYAEHAFTSEDAVVRQEAIATAYMLAVPSVWEACKREAESRGDACRLPLGLLALHPANRPALMAKLGAPDARRHAVWALGFAGDVEAVDALMTVLEDEEVAPIAGESLTAITGITIAGQLSVPGETKGPDVDEVGLDDPPPEVPPDDGLSMPNAELLRKWWEKARGQLQPGVRYVRGYPWGVETVRAAMRSGATWRRPVLQLELAGATRRSVEVDGRGWARGQR
jgi:uncharacterized protein (TIGR02270 family)